MNGTSWTEPGTGATERELRKALNPIHFLADGLGQYADDKTPRTDLKLTGHPLLPYDMERIKEALHRVKRQNR